MRFKLLFIIYFLAILMQPVVAIDTSAKNATLQMTTTLENSDIQLQFNYAKDINDDRGITFGCVGFCTGTYDGNKLIKYYTTLNQSNTLAKYIPALDVIDAGPHNAADGDGNPSVMGLSGFITDVRDCNDPLFTQAQLYELDQFYWNPSVSMWNNIGAKNSLMLAFIYDMSIRHGVNGAQNIINQAASAFGGTPKTGIDENKFLLKMITIRDAALKSENIGDVDRDAGYEAVLASGNVNLSTPFAFTSYDDSFIITGDLGIALATTPTRKDYPVAEFSTNTSYGCVPLPIKFTDLSQNASGWSWDFNNDEVADSSDESPVYVYTVPGNYTVSLKVSNENGTASKNAIITVLTDSNSSIESSSSSHSSGSGGSGGAGGSPEPQSNVEVKELSQTFVTSGNHAKFNFPQKTTPVVYISFDSKKTAGKITTICEMLKAKSTLVSGLPSDKVYKFLNIWVGNSGFATSKNVENAVVCFKVEKSWVHDKKIDKSSIVLNRYSDNKWSKLPTNLSSEDNNYLYLTAQTPGFSPFAIMGRTIVNGTGILSTGTRTQPQSGKETQIKPNNGNTTAYVKQTTEQKNDKSTYAKESKKTLGFEIVFGIIGLSCLLYFGLK